MPKVKIQQIKVVAAILNELAKQVPELKISQEQLAVVTTAAAHICSAFDADKDGNHE
ncbi:MULTISPECIES: hypothetical protein [Providencia]|uniref:hypothetical protein n=1 Tax=Providencia TaxID=586 RepID=UPI0015D5DEDA|nr:MULTISPECIES: hypothetical protein [Providencia]EIL1983328.1 hypothetical protein [Providencia rettgeri]EIL1983447.1 hypothetical protein [Providencia rettgeri]EIU9514241.1 hypothetical protein [Providencia rettgeri]EJD6670145.1 hypothetical protein [Providencia rettgeri]ELR5093762.1 hypothetical protein [Providencia rettgeri]